jgi:hypothetical protein
MRLLAPAALAAAAAALLLAPRSAAAQKALATSSDGSGAYCVWTSGTSAGTGTCDGSYAAFRAEWSSSNRPSGVIRIIKNDGTCLDASGGPGRAVRSLRCNDGASQAWTIHTTGQIESQQHAGQCLDVAGGLGANRTVLLYGCDYAPDAQRRNNQRFVFGTVKPRSLVSGATSLPLNGLLAPGRTVVDARSGGVIAVGGGNVVSAGGANVVSAGGANVVAAGSANVIAVGGGN